MENSKKTADVQETPEINKEENDQEVENIDEALKNPNLTKKQKENLKKKLKKKLKKEKTQEEEKETVDEIVPGKKNEGETLNSIEDPIPSDFKTELEWCVKQIRLGLSSNVVSKDQSKRFLRR